MSFQPVFTSSYLPIPTASFGASGSIGSTQLRLLQSNMDWIYHYNSTQTLINFNAGANYGVVGFNLADFSSQSGSYRLVTSFGPFRINLDKNKQPNPLFIMANAQVLHGINAGDVQGTGSFYFILHGVNENGAAFPMQTGQLVQSSAQANISGIDSQYWHVLTTSNAPIGFATTSSVLAMDGKATALYPLPTRTTKSLTGFNIQKDTCMAYLDVYVSASKPVGTTSYMRAYLWGLYAREICFLEGYSQ